MPEDIEGSTPKRADECPHSKVLPYGAFAMLALYWGAKYPQVHSVVPHLAGMTNAVAGALSIAVSGQSAKQAKSRTTKLLKWFSQRVEISGPVTIRLGKKGEKPPP